MSCKIVYGSSVTLAFDGAVDFLCTLQARVHDNLSTSGIRERVVEAVDMLISFTLPKVRVSTDLAGWEAFAAWAINGAAFDFYPDVLQAHFHCQAEDQGMEMAHVALGVYCLAFRWRVVPDSVAPADCGIVMKRYYGITVP